MLKHELIKEVSTDTGVPQQTVRHVLESVVTTVTTALRKGRPVHLFGLGKLFVSQRGPKRARNIWTGEDVTVPPRTVAVFRPSVAVDEAAKGTKGD